MLTASVVTYHTSLPEAGAVLDCVLRSSIDKLYIIDNSRNDALRILEKRSSASCWQNIYNRHIKTNISQLLTTHIHKYK